MGIEEEAEQRLTKQCGIYSVLVQVKRLCLVTPTAAAGGSAPPRYCERLQ